MIPDLDRWLPDPRLCVHHERRSSVTPDALWAAARCVRIDDTGLLGRLVRWRIPGTRAELEFDELFRRPPFIVLEDGERGLVSGLVGRIWTLRRDYPQLGGGEEFAEFSRGGTAKVVFANWVQAEADGGSRIISEARVSPVGRQGRIGLAMVGPLVARFHPLVGSEGIAAAVRRAEGR